MKSCVMIGLLLGLVSLPAAAQVDLEPFLRDDPYESLKISPNGDYFATTAPLEDRGALVIVRRSDYSVTAKVVGNRNSVVDNFWWANSERVVVSMANKFGSRDKPMPIGQLHAINVDGKNARVLASPFGVEDDRALVSEPPRAVFFEGRLPGDDRNVLVSSMPFANEPFVKLEKLDIYTRRRVQVATAPVRRAEFLVDAKGQARFAWGANADNVSRLYYRDNDQSEWRVVNDEDQTHRREIPLGFSADGKIAYLNVEQKSGPNRIMGWEPASGDYTLLLADETVDPYSVLYDIDNITPIGASFMGDRTRNRFFDEKSPTARLYRSLEKAFTDEALYITSVTADGKWAVVYAWSDRNAGDYFLFDLVNKQAERIFGRREWFKPAVMAPSREISFKARDSLPIHGYLTTPREAAKDSAMPLVLMPHGGPFGIFDKWMFDDEAQLLAQAGYAVLQVNYRGSGNYGRAFTQAGAQEWGGQMQDDLTDATRWAIEQGIADPERICIYGASYGGYAALMGVAKEPDLYRCAAGYVGVYDLRMMHRTTSSDSRSGRTWAGEWLGDPESLADHSPVTLAARIKAPVLLAAGGKDERAPVAHTEKMEKALKNAGVPVESLYYATEGHGFYTREHRREYYTRLLAFLSRHLGGKTAR